MNRLEQILSIQSESYNQFRMFAYIIRRVKSTPGAEAFVQDGNVYVTKGNGPVYPCVVAHMDTVHSIGDDLSIYRVGTRLTGFNRVTMRQTGIGGDDKVGIYIAFECLDRFDNIKIAFFRDEEVGCAGSYSANLPFFEDCSFVLQADRKGNSDFVTNASGTELSSKQFRKAIKQQLSKHRYKFSDGMMTDVMALKEEGMDISAANVSCGYYRPHCEDEYVDTVDVQRCLNLFVDIIEAHGTTKFPHKSGQRKSFTSYNYYGGRYDPYNNLDIHTEKRDKLSSLDDEYDFVPSENVWKKKTKQVHSGWGYCECCTKEDLVTYDRQFDAYICAECASDFELNSELNSLK